ncbi:acetyl-CoA carboxylase carboxyltransferase subunit alpha [Nonomuraea fuscirosea]|uniref:acetyl-CoA carboxylase carboxyltransferase subunit alpha n=1 Tax=Nonomuraea fuscirosea TaxID=1291556 RepID=UPI0033D8FD51
MTEAPVWIVCRQCGVRLYRKRFEQELQVCRECGHHARLDAFQRIDQLLDQGSAGEMDFGIPAGDPLGFTDRMAYPDRLAAARAATGLCDAAVSVRGTIEGRPVILLVMDFAFLGGSLGASVGDLVVGAADAARQERIPLIVVTASGGARMQEGVLALMQMARTSQALAELDEAGVLTITIVTDPTFGGVAASFATQTDVIIAEPGARMGFAGKRVIEQTIGKRLPADFQTASSLMEHGLIDDVVPRVRLRTVLSRLLSLTDPPSGGDVLLPVTPPDRLGEPETSDPWQMVRRARELERPTTLDYIHHMYDGFKELHGDRVSGDCPAMIAGFGHLAGRPVGIIGQQKGHDAAELARRNFGMASPAGYRKAARLMALAEKLRIPVITLIDTPGAYPGVEAEANGQMNAIAASLRLMSGLRVPLIAVLTGEGGSGGALALALADRVLALEHAVYSVISPEGCASILWRSQDAAPTAARALKVTPSDLLRLGIVDDMVPEPPGGAQRDHARAAEILRARLTAALDELTPWDSDALVRGRRARFARFGAQPVKKEVSL